MIVPSIRALAPHVGMSHQALDKHRKRGKFSAEPGGGYDVEKVKAALKRNADLAQPSQAKGIRETANSLKETSGSLKETSGRSVVVEAEPQPHGGWLKREREQLDPSEESTFAEYNKAKAAREKTRAKREEIALKVTQGELISSSDAIAEWGRMISSARSAILLLPAKLAPKVCVLSDVRDCQVACEREVVALLSELSEYTPETPRNE